MSSSEKAVLRDLSFRRVGEGFIVNASFGNGPKEPAIFEEKVAANLPKLKKVLKFYLDELKEDLNAN